MHTNTCSRYIVALAVIAITACSQGKPSSATGENPGQTGSTFLVTISRQAGGTVSSGADGKINCGTGASSCGPATYSWGETVSLTATPDAGKMFGTWAGDCTGRTKNAAGQYVCVLDTRQYGADKFVAAVFGEDGRTQHGNFNDPALHGAEFLNRVANKPDTFDCVYCHATNYDGLGIALSCNDCHERKGHANWQSDCNFCHGAPPPTSEGHPPTTSAITGCAACHPETVDGTGKLIPGGPHMDGTPQASGGHGDYTSPALHGAKFFDFVATAQGACTDCHGSDYATPMNTQGESCNSCHAGADWTSWRTNCSFCHGEKTTGSQRGGYDLALFPMWSAPSTGAHQAHLTAGAGKGGRFTAPFACATCHTVPTNVGHIAGSAGAATVSLANASRAALPAEMGSYNPASGTCTTYCHGDAAASPSWTAATPAFACGACHGLAPAPSTGHPAVSSALTGCAICHDATMNADGTIDLTSGTHLDGQVQRSALHGDYQSQAVHGPKFFGFIGGAGGDCRTCHGANDGGGIGPSCNGCHSGSGWTSWQSNCSFCHGEKNTESQRGGYDLALRPMWSAPDVGAHEAHLTGVTAGGLSFAKPFKCSTCHPVPNDLSHIGGADAQATVALVGDGQPSLPASLGSYNPTSGSCSTYCHGSAASPVWLATGLECGACHALPPLAATGHPAVSGALTGCSLCHPDTVKPDGTLDVAGGKHVNGIEEKTNGHSDMTPSSVHGPEFFRYLAGTSTLDCKSCHGATYSVGCNGCHSSAGWANWQTNCSFCHGARNATTKAGYSFASNPAWSAPPETVSGFANPARTGAHQAHLSGISTTGTPYGQRFDCATCHTVPGDLSHAAGPERARVTLSNAGRASLPANLGSYDASTGTCATYCHGYGTNLVTNAGSPPAQPTWSGSAVNCGTSCHGSAPPTGQVMCAGCHYGPNGAPIHNIHDWEISWYGTYGPDTCATCHATTIGSPGQPTGGAHVNGTRDVVFLQGGSWNSTTGKCTTWCHGGSELSWR